MGVSVGNWAQIGQWVQALVRGWGTSRTVGAGFGAGLGHNLARGWGTSRTVGAGPGVGLGHKSDHKRANTDDCPDGRTEVPSKGLRLYDLWTGKLPQVLECVRLVDRHPPLRVDRHPPLRVARHPRCVWPGNPCLWPGIPAAGGCRTLLVDGNP